MLEADQVDAETADTLEVEGDPKSSSRIIGAIKKAERALNAWQADCDNIDDVYSRRDVTTDYWADPDYDLFWASMEIMKPAVYAHPPQPVVSPQFKDRRQLPNVTAELLERSTVSAFDRTDMDEAMQCTRDDLIFYNRGQMWVTYETDEKGGGQRICVEHVDRKDFLHPPARKWSELPWVARRAWMTKTEMRKRFGKTSGKAYQSATVGPDREYRDDNGAGDHSRKVGVWEVWHKADDKVYWVAEGVDVILDEDKPHLKLQRFFPCPKPAYGTRRARTLIPVPDYSRYSGHFKKIDSLTRRIYDLLDQVRMKGLIPAGGEVGDAVEQALRDDSDTSLLIPVPAAALMQHGANGFVQWLPLQEIAGAIQGLIEARGTLIQDFYQLSGISDIMRGATEAEETLGAQQLKAQYGSVRVREKIEEMQRIARDVTQIAAEIMADNFSRDTLLEMSQMEVPTKSDIEKSIKELEQSAREELEAASKQAAQASRDPQQAEQAGQMFEQAKQQIVAKYGPLLQQAAQKVPIEDVMSLLRDERARGFAFEIATDSTILTDEMAEKQNRNEFLTVFSGATQGLMSIAALGEAGAKLAGEVLKFVLQPYRVGRELNSVIDEFIDAAPQMAEQAKGEGDSEGIAELAEAEKMKAQAQQMKVEADAAKNQAENERKLMEMQQKAESDRAKLMAEAEKLRQSAQATMAKAEEAVAKVDLIRAQTMKALAEAGVVVDSQALDEFKSLADIELRKTDQTMKAQTAERDAAFRSQDNMRAERGEQRADRQQDFSETQGDRQQTLAERQAMQERGQ